MVQISNINPFSSTTAPHETRSNICPHPQSSIIRSLRPGIYVPTLAFFDSLTEDLDLPTTTSHAIRLAHSGIAGLVVQGSNGEAVHLSDTERNLITRTTREALDSAGFSTMPIIVGCGAQSTREVIALCHDAADFGGDFTLVLPPSYYKGLFDEETIVKFFIDVAEESPLPVIVYNFPGVACGLDMSSDVLTRLGEHKNIAGCKFTCGNMGKMSRVTAAFKGKISGTSGSLPEFQCFGGSGDSLLSSMINGGAGIIGGIGNLAPKTCVMVMRMWREGKIAEATRLQEVLARGDWAAIKSGVIGTKAALVEYYGYGGVCRRPLPRPQGKEFESMVEGFGELIGFEKTCD